MRFVRLVHGGQTYFARLIDDETARLWTGPPFLESTETDRLVPLRGATLLCPVTPSKIVCVGRNYREHAAELGNEVPETPLLFLKPPSALLPAGAPIVLPAESQRVDYEGEVGVVIGRRVIRGESAEGATFGVLPVNDVTARDLQRKDVQFTRGKSFDSFCPCGPWVETTPPPLDDLRLETRVNGDLVQSATTSELVWGIEALMTFIASVMTLEPGDLILTGTPAGVGPLRPGDRCEVAIAEVGSLVNPVQASVR